MRPAPFAALTLAALTLVFMSAAACAAKGAGDTSFDLVCRGQLTRNGATSPFETRLHVDLASRRFCLDECLETFHLSEATADRLAYHYDVAVADADHAANRYRGQTMSSAGPFPLTDVLAVDRRTSAYSRAYHYRMGDPAARDDDDRYVGQCRVMPFTGLAARAG